MDWDEIIERNTERLLAVIAQLFFRSGLDEGGAAFLPRRAWRALLIMLRPAESAVRRLIVIAARGIVVKLRAARGFPNGLKLGLMTGIEKNADRIPAFLLIDPLKRFAPADFEWSKEWGKDWGKIKPIPRISVPGLFDPIFATPAPAPAAHDLIPAAALCRRIAALKEALGNLPRHALRLARWRARRALKKTGRKSPFRPGFAPGYHRHKPREIDALLSDCHYFAQEAWYADTS